MQHHALLLARCLAALLVATCARATPQTAGDVVIEKATFGTKDGGVAYELGTLHVPETRGTDSSRVIGVGFARFASRQQPPTAPPVFLLPGGPGGSIVSWLQATGGHLEKVQTRIAGYTAASDLVIVDQRGFSERGDQLMQMMAVSYPTDRPRSIDDDVAAFSRFAKRTTERFAEKKIDLSGYNVKECAHDVDALRTALGYEKITLCGTSFGSQWSFAVMRLHPGIVARALLSGVEPLDHGYDMPSYVFAAVQRMWRTIDADERFKPFLPEGGMAEAALIVIERLERNPIKVETTDARTGVKKTVCVLGPTDFPWSNPTAILELYHGHLRRWESRPAGGFSRIPLIGPLIDTSLGVTPERRHRLWTDPATRYLGRSNFASYLATADIWPSPDVGDAFRTPLLCDIPVVFAHGTWDVKTPLENTFEIAPFFTNSRVLIAERGGHGVLEPIKTQLPEVWATLERFIRTGDMLGIPARVTLQPSRTFSPPKITLAPR